MAYVPTGQQVGDFFMGNGNTPGFFGSGQYAINNQAYSLPGFQNFQNMANQYAQQNQGIDPTVNMRAATPEEQAKAIAARMGGVPSGMMDPNQVTQGTNQVAVQPPPGTAPPPPPPGTDWRNEQGQLAQGLFGTINGTQPSVAQQQLQMSTQGNVANAYAMAAASGNPAAARTASMQAGNLNQQGAGQAALLRAQEIERAQGQLGNVLGGARGQDTSGTLGFMNLGLQAAGQQQQGQISADQARAQAYSDAAGRTIGGKVLAAGLGAAAGAIGGPRAATGASRGAQGGPSADGGGGSEFQGYTSAPAMMAIGGVVPGYAMGGDSAANDSVPAMLSPGEIVLPRSVAQSPDAEKKAAMFVAAIKAKHTRRKAA